MRRGQKSEGFVCLTFSSCVRGGRLVTGVVATEVAWAADMANDDDAAEEDPVDVLGSPCAL